MSNNSIKRGINDPRFLHTHPQTERQLGLDPHHCIVDREDLEEAKRLLSCVSDTVKSVTEEPLPTAWDEKEGYLDRLKRLAEEDTKNV